MTAGQCGDSPQFEAVLEKVRVPRIGVGRPRVRPDRVRAGKAYASRMNRAYLRRRGAVFAVQHSNWRDDYRKQVAELHAPAHRTYVAVAEAEGTIAGHVAWSVAPARKKGEITILALSNRHRRHHVGATLCEHACEQMRALGAEVVEIGTVGDQFHAPARALYEALGCTPLPLTVCFRQL